MYRKLLRFIIVWAARQYCRIAADYRFSLYYPDISMDIFVTGRRSGHPTPIQYPELWRSKRPTPGPGPWR